MKKNFLSLLILVLILSTSTILASSYSETIVRYYKDIKIKLNGEEIIPKDANGNIVEPFIIDGTTYLPVRAIANALELEVNWNEANNTINLFDSDSTSEITNKIPTIEKFNIVKRNSSKKITSTQEMYIGDILKLDVAFSPANATIEEIRWESYNPDIAKVSSSGTVTAKSVGTTTIKATEPITGFFHTIKVKIINNEIIDTNTVNNTTQNKTEDKSYYEKYVKNSIEGEMNSRGLLDSSITQSMVNSALSEVANTSIEKLKSSVYTTKGNSYYHDVSCSNLNGALISYVRYKAIAKSLKACPICNP